MNLLVSRTVEQSARIPLQQINLQSNDVVKELYKKACGTEQIVFINSLKVPSEVYKGLADATESEGKLLCLWKGNTMVALIENDDTNIIE